MVGSTDVENLQNATLETLEYLTTELTDERFPFDYIQTLNAEDVRHSRRQSRQWSRAHGHSERVRRTRNRVNGAR